MQHATMTPISWCDKFFDFSVNNEVKWFALCQSAHKDSNHWATKRFYTEISVIAVLSVMGAGASTSYFGKMLRHKSRARFSAVQWLLVTYTKNNSHQKTCITQTQWRRGRTAGGGQLSHTHLKFGLSENCQKIFFCKIWGWKTPILKTF